jgi:hypothetical protein
MGNLQEGCGTDIALVKAGSFRLNSSPSQLTPDLPDRAKAKSIVNETSSGVMEDRVVHVNVYCCMEKWKVEA